MKLRVLLLWLGAILPRAASGQVPDGSTPRCYAFHYWGKHARDSLSYAAGVTLRPGSDSGHLESRPYPPEVTRNHRGGAFPSFGWEEFEDSAQWVRISPDTMQLRFSHGFMRVAYTLRMLPDSLIGSVEALAIATAANGEPRIAITMAQIDVSARAVPCP